MCLKGATRLRRKVGSEASTKYETVLDLTLSRVSRSLPQLVKRCGPEHDQGSEGSKIHNKFN